MFGAQKQVLLPITISTEELERSHAARLCPPAQLSLPWVKAQPLNWEERKGHLCLEATHLQRVDREEELTQVRYQTQLLTWPIRVHQFTSKYSQSLFTSLENDCPFPKTGP